MIKKEISTAVVKRLPRYYRYLGELLESGIVRISSKELSSMMNVTASQIRQDLNNFGGFGQQGYGYNVEILYNEIGKILGIDRTYNLIIIGAGNLGQAIANYGNFEKRGFIMKAIFDNNDTIVGKDIKGTPVLHIDELEDYVNKNKVDIAAIAIPKEPAAIIAKRLIDSGVKAFWNFAHTDLNVKSDIIVENVHLSESLMRLSYKLVHSDNQ